jgi:hypothetical protein
MSIIFTIKKSKSIEQIEIAKIVATKLGLTVGQVIDVIETEQQLTMSHVKRGFRVVKKNYLTLIPTIREPYTLISKLDKKEYKVDKRVRVKVKVGQGFKSYVADKGKSMPNKICRFVGVELYAHIFTYLYDTNKLE